jgi:hypothetical protein
MAPVLALVVAAAMLGAAVAAAAADEGGLGDPTAEPPAAALAAAAAPRTPRLSWWVDGPINGGCPGWGLPYPGFSPAAKRQPSCWNNTFTLMAEHAELIDEVELSVGLGLSNVSHGLIDLDRDGSEWGPGYRIKPEEWLSHYVPDLLAVLKPHTEIMIPFFFGQGKDNNATQVAQQGYANADALAAQMVQLATDHDWISGYLLDYEVYCGETVESRAQCVPLEAERLTAFFKTLSTALHAKGKKLGFCTNKNGAGFEHWPYYSQYLAAGVDRLYEMGTYLNHTKHGGPSDRENVTQQLFTYPLQHTAFGLGDYGLVDTTEEAAAWLHELYTQSAAMEGDLQVHVFDLFGARPPTTCANISERFDHSCPRPPMDWWPVLEQFHSGHLH